MDLIQPPIGQVFYKTNDWGDTKDIISAILEADETAPLYTVDFANSIPAENVNDICRFLYDYVRRNVAYKEDEDGRQDVQMPGVLVDKKYGDCKSMSLFCASVLKNLNIPYKYRFISQDPKSDLHHVYLVVTAENGKKITLDCVENSYNNEVKYVKKKDMRSKAKIGAINFNPMPVMPVVRPASLLPASLLPSTLDLPAPQAAPKPNYLLWAAAAVALYFIIKD